MTDALGAGKSERSDGRRGYRSGQYPRTSFERLFRCGNDQRVRSKRSARANAGRLRPALNRRAARGSRNRWSGDHRSILGSRSIGGIVVHVAAPVPADANAALDQSQCGILEEQPALGLRCDRPTRAAAIVQSGFA